jgi:hypothetical protein
LANCNVTYRLLDAYFDVFFLQQSIPPSKLAPLKSQIDDKDKVFSFLAAKWEKEKIYNTMKSDSGAGIALDTYCILGFIQGNNNMANVVSSYLNEENDWIPSNYYTSDTWRNIADETWCVRLFIKTKADKELTATIIEKLIGETEVYIHSNETDLNKLSVVYHTLYMLSDFGNSYADKRFDLNRTKYADYCSYFATKNLIDDNLMLSNLLDVLIHSKFDNPAILDQLALKILNSQKPEGYWKMREDFPDNYVQTFTTFRALIALNEYKTSHLT